MAEVVDLCSHSPTRGSPASQKRKRSDSVDPEPKLETAWTQSGARLQETVREQSSKIASLEARLAKAQKPQPSVTGKCFALIWICVHGFGQKKASSATQKMFKVLGVYSSQAAAQVEKDRIMGQYECCGHGDILTGDTWKDEIALLIKPTKLCLE